MKYLIADEIVELVFTTDTAIKQFDKFRTTLQDSTIHIDMNKVDDFNRTYNHLSKSQCELLFSMQLFFLQAINKDKLILHATTIVVDNKGYILIGKAGSGKSTMAHKWMKYFGNKAFILNDDRTIIGEQNGCLVGWMSPWSKLSNGNSFKAYEISGVALISQNQITTLMKNDIKETVNSILNEYPEQFRKTVKKFCELYLKGINTIDVKSNNIDLDIGEMYRMMSV